MAKELYRRKPQFVLAEEYVGPPASVESNRGPQEINSGDFLVDEVEGNDLRYPISPKTFHQLYESVQEDPDEVLSGRLTFAEALIAMEAGFRVRRAGWNGKGMWICKAKGHPGLEAAAFWNYHTRKWAERNGGKAKVESYYLMKTATGSIVMGWLASQTDMGGDADWEVLDGREQDEADAHAPG